MKSPTIDWSNKALGTHTARLMPPPRSKPEGAATTTLLSVLGSVDEFGMRFMKRVGGPAYAQFHRYYRGFCETPVRLLEQAAGLTDKSLVDSTPAWGKHDRPDGVIVVSRNKEWKALVEVKTGSDTLAPDQVAAYHHIAQHLGFDLLITISNEAGGLNGEPPASAMKDVRAAMLKKIPIAHVQWRDLLGDGLALHAKHLEDNVADEDQDWILGEWLRYIHDERSEILIPARLGDGWTEVLQLVKSRLLLPDSKELHDVVGRWDDLAREIEFQMRLNGISLEPKLSRAEKNDTALRSRTLIAEATEHRRLSLSWKCPSPIDTFHCVVDLDARIARYHFEVNNTSGKSAAARIMCWAGQIKTDKASEVVVRPKWKKPAIETPLLLADCKGVHPLNAFLKSKGIDTNLGTPTRIAFEWHRPLEGRAGRGGQTHLEQICAGVHEFYSEVMAGLRSVDALPAETTRRSSSPSAMEPSAADVTIADTASPEVDQAQTE